MTISHPEYHAARNSSAVVRESWMGLLRLTGPERQSWLQGMVTNEVGKLAKQLKSTRDALVKVRDKAEHMHDDPTKAAMLLTHEGADAMSEVRSACDALELLVADEAWPLPKYREMLFPV